MVTMAAWALLGLLSGPGTPGTPVLAATGPGAVTPDLNGQRAMARVERHIAELHRRLGITAAQEPQWTGFADAMRANAQAVEMAYAGHQAHAGPSGSPSAIDALRSYAANARQHADALDRLVAPFDAVYASLSPEQRSTADQVFQSFQRGAARRGS